MRELVIENHFDEILFERTTEVTAKLFNVDTTAYRIDSMHIKSNTSSLRRIGIKDIKKRILEGRDDQKNQS